jgi:recombinational DNA repair ATPase RecF
MNDARRKALKKLQDKVAELRENITEDLEEILVAVEEIKGEEEEAYENLPESLQQGQKGDRAQAAITALEELQSGLEELRDFDFDQIDSSFVAATE